MKKAILIFIAALATVSVPTFAYYDSRGHNLDSLERVVARWTPDVVDKAPVGDLIDLNRAYRNLMLGYNQINREKSLFYARKALSISEKEGWMDANTDAWRYIGQYYYGKEQYDSARVYYMKALEAVDSMAAGATSPTCPDGYPQRTIDDQYSALYGAIGNLYNMMDSIPQAMQWYEKAGGIFEKYGWNESNSILHYNMGETWIDEGEMEKAAEEYEKAMGYAEASGDSLMIVDVWKGFGRLYMEQGKPWKSLPYLRRADAYYAAHPDFDPDFRTENLEYMSLVLASQKKLLTWLVAGLLLLVAAITVTVLVWIRRSKSGRKGDDSHVKKTSVDAPSLTARETEILDLISKGYTTPQIAAALNLSPETIRWYRKNLLSKLDVSNTAELVSVSKELGLV